MTMKIVIRRFMMKKAAADVISNCRNLSATAYVIWYNTFPSIYYNESSRRIPRRKTS